MGRPSSSVARLHPVSADARGHRRAIRAYARASAAGGGLDGLLRALAAELCALVGVPRCSVYLRDGETGLYRGRVGHGADDRLVKRLTCGLHADRFTREIVDTRAPVVLQDAMNDPRAIMSTMRAWGVNRVMGVPIVAGDDVIGIFFLDTRDRAHVFREADEDVAAAFAELAAAGIGQEQALAGVRASLATVSGQHAALRRAAAVDERLTTLVLDGGGLAGIAAALAELTTHGCSIYGADLQPLATAWPGGAPVSNAGEVGAPDLATVLRDAELDPARPATLGPLRAAGPRTRLLTAPVVVRGERWGVVALSEQSRRFGALDALVVRRAASIVALELSAARRTAAAALDARAALAAALVRGDESSAEIERRALLAGVRLDAPRVACHLAPRAGVQMPDARAVVSAVDGHDVLVGRVDEGLAALVALPPSAAAEVLAGICREHGLVAGVSSAPAGPAQFPRAYDEARQCARCLTAFGSARAVVTAGELGPARVFLASCDPGEAIRFADEALARLDGHDELLDTLDVFLGHAASARRTAGVLGVHENTVRYRLARIEELTAAAVTTAAEDQLRLRLALAVRNVRA